VRRWRTSSTAGEASPLRAALVTSLLSSGSPGGAARTKMLNELSSAASLKASP
jgi:hypothetical protein